MDSTCGSAAEISAFWWFWPDCARTPALNMAIDEALLRASSRLGRPLLRFYGWDRPAISIGYTQKIELTERPGFAVVRRPTGGGVVCHDHDFTYTVTIPPSHPIAAMTRRESYRAINEAVRSGLRDAKVEAALADQEIPGSTERAAMVCFDNPTRYDLLADGRKIAGSAQRRTGDGILHQGSIHFGRALPIPRSTMQVILREGFARSLGIEFVEIGEVSAILDAARDLACQRYACDEWNRRR